MKKKKIRTKISYLGNTIAAQKRQRLNLTPGSSWDKRHRKELKLDCWWWTLPLGNMREIYEFYENERDIEDVPKEELKSEEFLDDEWWQELTIKQKDDIIKSMKDVWIDKDEESHKKIMYELLEEQIKEEGKERRVKKLSKGKWLK